MAHLEEVKQTKSDNELIAEFMGYEKSRDVWEKGEYAYTMKLPDVFNKWVIPSHMRFATSWDWLMPVVEKIDSLRNTSFEMYPAYAGVGNRIGVGVIISTHRKDFEVLVLPNGRTRIEVVYKAVVEFIKWYNQQNPTPHE